MTEPLENRSEGSLAIFSGDIVIDGISIKQLGLHDLRSAVAIIPQEPALFEGTVRRNLDPFGQKSDEELWRALDEAKLKDTIDALPGGLSTIITEEGEFALSGRKLNTVHGLRKVLDDFLLRHLVRLFAVPLNIRPCLAAHVPHVYGYSATNQPVLTMKVRF